MDGVLLIQWNRAAVSVGIMSAVASVGVPEIGLLFPILLIVSLFYNLTFGGHPAASFMMALPLLMNLRDWNRTILTTVLLSIVLYLVVGGIFRLGKFLAVAAAVALVASGPLFVAFDLGNSRLGQRISEMTDFDLDPHASKEIAVSQRFFEAEAVFDEFRKATPFAYLTGFGVGATFDMQGSRDDSVKDGAILGRAASTTFISYRSPFSSATAWSGSRCSVTSPSVPP